MIQYRRTRLLNINKVKVGADFTAPTPSFSEKIQADAISILVHAIYNENYSAIDILLLMSKMYAALMNSCPGSITTGGIELKKKDIQRLFIVHCRKEEKIYKEKIKNSLMEVDGKKIINIDTASKLH